jgi:hypothetical protein
MRAANTGQRSCSSSALGRLISSRWPVGPQTGASSYADTLHCSINYTSYTIFIEFERSRDNITE